MRIEGHECASSCKLAEKGLFIAVEGIDGSGKTTLANMLGEEFDKAGRQAFVLPSGGIEARGVEPSLKMIATTEGNGLASASEVLVYCAALAQRINQYILPKLNEGMVVVVDRYALSTYVHVRCMLDVDSSESAWLVRFASRSLVPHLTILCDSEPAVAFERVLSRGGSLTKRERRGVPLFSSLRKGFLEEAPAFSKQLEIIRTDVKGLEETRRWTHEIVQACL